MIALLLVLVATVLTGWQMMHFKLDVNLAKGVLVGEVVLGLLVCFGVLPELLIVLMPVGNYFADHYLTSFMKDWLYFPWAKNNA